MQSAIGFERQLPFHTAVAIAYANSHGLHMLRSRDINAPLPGTLDPQTPGSGVFPIGTPGPIFLMESSGVYNQNQLITNINAKATENISVFGLYVYNRAMSDADASGRPRRTGTASPANTVRPPRMSVGGPISTRWNVRLSPLLVMETGPPFDITVGRDPVRRYAFQRAAGFATDPNKPGVIATGYGLLDPTPTTSPEERRSLLISCPRLASVDAR